MNIRKRYRFTFLVAAALLITSMACNLTSRFSQAPEDTEQVTATEVVENPQTEESQNPQALEIYPAATPTESQASEPVKIVIDQDQLTAMAVKELQTQQDQTLEDPQIFLRDGQVQVFGNVNQGGLTLPLKMVLTVSVNDQGKPHFHVESANLGPLPLPQSTLDQLSTQLDDTLADNLGPKIDDLYIEDITIADGVMTVTGHPR